MEIMPVKGLARQKKQCRQRATEGKKVKEKMNSEEESIDLIS